MLSEQNTSHSELEKEVDDQGTPANFELRKMFSVDGRRPCLVCAPSLFWSLSLYRDSDKLHDQASDTLCLSDSIIHVVIFHGVARAYHTHLLWNEPILRMTFPQTLANNMQRDVPLSPIAVNLSMISIAS